MRYNSLDHFIGEHAGGLAGLVETAQRQAGGHYARMTPTELHQNAANDSQYIARVWREGQFDRHDGPEIAHQAESAGIDLDDLTRMVDLLLPLMLDFAERELAEQPNLAIELSRRIRNTATAYRSGITAAKLDQTLRRFGPR